MSQSQTIRTEKLSENHSEEIPIPYIQIFTDHPWHEEFACQCGKGPYSLGCKYNNGLCEQFESGKLIKIENEKQRCKSCDSLLTDSLHPYYTHSSVMKEFLEFLNKPGFTGFGAIKFGKLVAMCWGYDYPINASPQTGSTWYHEAIPQLETLGINPQKAFYHNESGTLTEHRGHGIGTIILAEMLKSTAEMDHTHVVFRTINPAMIRCYEKAFNMERGSLKPMFSDPDPNKRQEWFALDLNKIRV